MFENTIVFIKEKYDKLKNNTIKNDTKIKGAKGTSDDSLSFFLNNKTGIAYNAPIQKERKTNKRICRGSLKNNDNTKINFQSAKPIALPLEKNQRLKNGNAAKKEYNNINQKEPKSKLNVWKLNTL